jgi:hypothetical protein
LFWRIGSFGTRISQLFSDTPPRVPRKKTKPELSPQEKREKPGTQESTAGSQPPRLSPSASVPQPVKGHQAALNGSKGTAALNKQQIEDIEKLQFSTYHSENDGMFF